ncbi:hypothetical protein MXD81_17985, partial [Microbacteriaceae bacterium K1510]|nr:hypothetical protein [Microbacteriaceae bacterium K1510]
LIILGNVQIDFFAAEPLQSPFQFGHHFTSRLLSLVVGIDSKVVYPSSAAIIAAHYGGYDSSIGFSYKKKLGISLQLPTDAFA